MELRGATKADSIILCLAGGFCGLYHFKLHQPILGILYALTAGFLGIGVLIDLIAILETKATKTEIQNYNEDLYAPCKAPQSKLIAILLAIFLGVLGGHKFYEKKYVIGVIYLFTLGLV